MSNLRAVEIVEHDVARFRHASLPEGVQAVELEEVEFFGKTYDRSPNSTLYLPTDADAITRATDRYLASAPEPEAPVAVEVFSGAGGFSLGIHQAGFDVVAAVEWDECASHTYMCNLMHPAGQLHFASPSDEARWRKYEKREATARGTAWYGDGYRASSQMPGGCRAFMFGDASKVDGRQLMTHAGVESVDLVFGGPPCQGLSKGNAKASLEDPRNGMLWEFMRIVSEIMPGGFFIENVPALLTIANGALFNALSQIANELGYDVYATKVDAVSYGVPQHRVRALIVGIKKGGKPFAFPMPTTFAIGRPIDGAAWNEPGADVEAPAATRASARFDMKTRKWSFDGTAPGPVSTEAPPPLLQNDLFSGPAA